MDQIGAGAGVVDDALDVAFGTGRHSDVREDLAIDTVLDHSQVEGTDLPGARHANLDFDAVRVRARVFPLDTQRIRSAGRGSLVQSGVEAEALRRRRAHLELGGHPGRDRAQLEEAARKRRHDDPRDCGLDDLLDLERGHRVHVAHVAGAEGRVGGEAKHRVRSASGHLDPARGAHPVARKPDGIPGDNRLPALEPRVDGGSHFVGGRAGDVVEVRGRECQNLRRAAVDPDREGLAVRQGERACHRLHVCGSPLEHRFLVCATIHGANELVAVLEPKGGGRGADDRRRGRCPRRREVAGRADRSRGARLGDLRVVARAHAPKLGPPVLEEPHRAERHVGSEREASESGLVLLEGRTQHRYVDGPALGDSHGGGDRGGSGGNASHARLFLHDYDFG